MSESTEESTVGRFDYERLERVFHERARLGLLVALSRQPEGLVFTELRSLCNLTDGNLNRHVHALEKERIVEIWKKTSAGRSTTLVRLTEAGRSRFEAYLAALEAVLADVKPVRRSSDPSS